MRHISSCEVFKSEDLMQNGDNCDFDAAYCCLFLLPALSNGTGFESRLRHHAPVEVV